MAWSLDYDCCQQCGTTEQKHGGKGLCRRCYTREWARQRKDQAKEYYRANRDKVQQSQKEYYERNREALTQKSRESYRQRRYGGNYEATLSRDNYRCCRCGATKNLHVHHIDRSGNTDSPNNDLENLQTLCSPCHTLEHSAEVVAARISANATRWSFHFDSCQDCGTTSLDHEAKGYCRPCYQRRYRARTRRHSLSHGETRGEPVEATGS